MWRQTLDIFVTLTRQINKQQQQQQIQRSIFNNIKERNKRENYTNRIFVVLNIKLTGTIQSC